MAAEGRVMELDLDDDDDDDTDAPNEADLVAELREFLDTFRPEDFGQ
jgi:hypothetical protein